LHDLAQRDTECSDEEGGHLHRQHEQ
jgi:hypothetical protein